jgi:general secretion pathway protein D
MNLKDADIQAVIRTVSDITGKNFIVDPRVKGRVTIISSQPMEADEVYQVFLSVLNVHGYAAIPDTNAVKIVPEVTAKQGAIPTVSDDREESGDQYVTRVIRVENVAARQLVPILRPLLPQEGHMAAYTPSNVLIASASAANLQRLVSIVRRIDLSSDAELEVLPLRHASAEEVVRILEVLNRGSARNEPGEAPRVVADVRTNSVLLSGDKGSRLRMRAIISHLDTPLEESSGTRVIYLRHGNAADMVPVLSSLVDGRAGKTGKSAADAMPVNIQADESLNAIVVDAAPDVMRKIDAVVRQLDVRRAQVMVEAVIAEVSAEKAVELGVQWGYDGSPDNQPVGVINFSGSGTGLGSLLSSPPSFGDGLTAVVGDTASSGGTRIGALVRALAGDADTNILSTPSLVTMDNQEAEIVVGQNVPFLTGSYSNTGGGSTPTNPFQTISRQDVGLTLKIKPQINDGGVVKLEIVQEVSSIGAGTTGAADLVTNKRSIKTSVLADDGQIVVLGGLIDDQLRESEQKVPGLGDIPILGWFFSYKKTTKLKRNLMVFIHPRIIRNSSDNSLVAGGKYRMLRDDQMLVREGGINLMSDSVSPLLPEYEEFLSLPPPYQNSGQQSVPGLSDEQP